MRPHMQECVSMRRHLQTESRLPVAVVWAIWLLAETATLAQTDDRFTYYPDVEFLWRGEAYALETWTEPGIGSQSVTVESRSPQGVVERVFVAPRSGVGIVSYTVGGRGEVSVFVRRYGVTSRLVLVVGSGSDSRIGTTEFAIEAGLTYTVQANTSFRSMDGWYAQNTVSYPIDISVSRSEPRMAVTSGRAWINTLHSPAAIGVIDVQPQPTRGGFIGPITYSVSDNSDLVETSVQGAFVYATTSHSVSIEKPRAMVRRTPSSRPVIAWKAEAGFDYVLERAVPGGTWSWTQVGSIRGGGGLVEIEDVGLTGNVAFYRVILRIPSAPY